MILTALTAAEQGSLPCRLQPGLKQVALPQRPLGSSPHHTLHRKFVRPTVSCQCQQLYALPLTQWVLWWRLVTTATRPPKLPGSDPACAVCDCKPRATPVDSGSGYCATVASGTGRALILDTICPGQQINGTSQQSPLQWHG